MGVITVTEQHTSSIPPSRLFKASIMDAHNLLPKIIPQVIKSMEFTQGNGQPGSIKLINFAQGSNMKYIKYRIDEVDEATYTYNYTVIEGDALTEKVEKIRHEVKLMAGPDGGTISSVISKYYTKDESVNEEEIKAGKEKVLGVYKVIEDYLIQNPNAYA